MIVESRPPAPLPREAAMNGYPRLELGMVQTTRPRLVYDCELNLLVYKGEGLLNARAPSHWILFNKF